MPHVITIGLLHAWMKTVICRDFQRENGGSGSKAAAAGGNESDSLPCRSLQYRLPSLGGSRFTYTCVH